MKILQKASLIEITRPDKTKETIIIGAGQGGNPQNCSNNIEGGQGGQTDNCILGGCDGAPGTISLPSYICSSGGNGGASLFHKGGVGGSSLFYSGGLGGDEHNLLGGNGRWGSGGGGSLKFIKNDSEQRSGNGGNALVRIDW